MRLSLAKKSYLARVCGSKWLPVGRVDDDGHKAAVIRLRCRSWSCPYCSRKKARRFAAATAEYLRGKRLRLLTLTMDRRHSLSASWREIGPAWNRLLTLMRRDFGRVSFVRVVEPQPRSGFPHYHILVDKFIPARWLKRYLVSCGFGKIFDIQGIQGNQSRKYISKYLRKPWPVNDGSDFAIIAGVRRISGSRGFSISIRSSVSWGLIDNLGFCDQLSVVGWWLDKTHPPSLYKLVHCSSSDDWLEFHFVPALASWLQPIADAGFQPASPIGFRVLPPKDRLASSGGQGPSLRG